MNKKISYTIDAPMLATAPLATAMEDAQVLLFLIAVELVAEYFIWKTPEARDIIDALPPLCDTRLDTDCTILITQHTSKARCNDGRHHTSRGGSALNGAT